MNLLAKTSLLACAALVGMGCATPAQRGAVTGGAVGAGLGAIIGGASGNPGVGAAIGAGVGAATGAVVGDAVDHERYGNGPHYHTTQGTYVYQERVAPPPAPPPSRHFSNSYRVEDGHYETRLVRAPSGEYYEERVWVPHR
jgi:uncharacterized protein YcfJ